MFEVLLRPFSNIFGRTSVKLARKPWILETLEDRTTPVRIEVLDSVIGSSLVQIGPKTASAAWNQNGVVSGNPRAFHSTENPSKSGISEGVLSSKVTNNAQSGIGDFHAAFAITHVGYFDVQGEIGSGDRRGSPITLKFSPGENETVGDPIRVTLNVETANETSPIFAFAGGSFTTGYSLDTESARILSGSFQGATKNTKTVALDAKIGDTIDVDFNLTVTLPATDTTTGNAAGILFRLKAEPAKFDIVAKSLTFNTIKNGADFKYEVTGGTLPAGDKPVVNFYWARGTTYAKRIGEPLFTSTIDKTSGTIHISSDKLVNLPFKVTQAKIDAGQNLLEATHLIAVIDPANKFAEASETNNVAHRALKRVVAKQPDFLTEFNGVKLNATLFTRFMKMAAHLVGNNYVTQDITLNEGVRDPKLAHKWSTSWKLRHPKNETEKAQLLKNLRALPGGKDLDGNLWYKKSWETGLQKVNGKFTAAALATLWNRIQKHALTLDNRSNKNLIAAEGYAVSDKHILPNIHPTVSVHPAGKAIDATIAWRTGAKVETLTIGSGATTDAAANKLVTLFLLKRNVPSEKHHFVLK